MNSRHTAAANFPSCCCWCLHLGVLFLSCGFYRRRCCCDTHHREQTSRRTDACQYLDSTFFSTVFVIASNVKARMSAPAVALTLARHLCPTPPEVAAMLQDLFDHFGTEQTAAALGLDIGHLKRIIANQKDGKPAACRPTAKLVWLVWMLVLRPGKLSDVFMLATCGRFSRDCSPETAGKVPGRPLWYLVGGKRRIRRGAVASSGVNRGQFPRRAAPVSTVGGKKSAC